MQLQTHYPAMTTVGTAVLFALIMLLSSLTPVAAGSGTLQLSLQGYGAVPGELQNTLIQPNNSVSMIMVVNNKIQTSNGPAQITANGVWIGVQSGITMSGQIRNIVGSVQVCMLVCVSMDFTGQGVWNGSLNGSHGTGAFNGAIIFTNSPVPQIQNGQPYGMSGTWSADFELPAPEFGQQTQTYLIVAFTLASLLLVSTRRLRNPEPPVNH